MTRYKLTIAYEGTRYSGWQVQPNALTIQEVIEEKIEIILQHPISLVGSGRTDAGVHAMGQVAHFDSDISLNLGKFRHSLNNILPPDIKILTVEEVAPTFHAQRSATGKEYHYNLWLDAVHPPFEHRRSLKIWQPLDIALLKEGAKVFIGRHNFTSFANSSTEGAVARNPFRTIWRVDVVQQCGGIRIEFEGEGFFYKMVRNIVGTLLELGKGKRTVESIQALFDAKDRRKAGRAAPAKGLFLMRVDYGD